MAKKSASTAARVVPAAGAVLWRESDESDDDGADAGPLIALVHRPRYDDWSLPKGKVDPGETEPVTAVREGTRGDGLRLTAGPASRRGELSHRLGRQARSVLGGPHARRRVHPQFRGRRAGVALHQERDEAPPVPP